MLRLAVVELVPLPILQDWARQAWWFLHSLVCWQTWASAIVLVFVPGHAIEFATVWQLVCAVIAFASASPQQTCPFVQSLADAHMKAAFKAGQLCEWGMHLPTPNWLMQHVFTWRSQICPFWQIGSPPSNMGGGGMLASLGPLDVPLPEEEVEEFPLLLPLDAALLLLPLLPLVPLPLLPWLEEPPPVELDPDASSPKLFPLLPLLEQAEVDAETVTAATPRTSQAPKRSECMTCSSKSNLPRSYRS
jgi:hypothetical protein